MQRIVSILHILVDPHRVEPSGRSRTIGLLLAMGATGSAIVLVLSLLFHVNGDPIPEEMAMLIAPAAAVLVVCLPLLLRRIDWSGASAVTAQPGLWRREREWRRQDKKRQACERERIERLARDPMTVKYAQALRCGDYWSDEAIAYDRDHSMLVTDAAIRPIERAMRDAGIPLRRGLGATLTAWCRIDAVRLYEQFPPNGRYHYTEDFHFDRPYDPGEKVIISTAGTSYIHIVDPDQNKDMTVFPQAASS